MWYPVADEVAAEPVTLDEAKAHLRTDLDVEDALIEGLIFASRAHVEAYCNQMFAAHAMTWACDSFSDLSRLPAAPAISITSIGFINLDGEAQTLLAGVYILRPDGLNPNIALVPGQSWPQIQPGSRITLTGEFGANCPKDVKHAILLLIGDDGEARGNTARPVWTTVDALLSNHRRGAW
jgi:uncharacterized phiE125 gp8 family phage protein